MNLYTFMGLDDVEEGEEISSHKKTFIKRAIAYIKTRRQATQVSRNSITRDRAGAHEHLVAAYFTDSPMYNEKRFRQTFQMARPLFNQIVNAVTTHSAYFQSNPDYAGRESISPLIKCTSAIRQLAYVYKLCTGSTNSFSTVGSIKSYEDLFPTVTDVEKLYRHHEEKHGFPGMLGSLDCTDWEWFVCPYAFKGQYVRRDHGLNPFILLEAVASQDLWIWHAFFGVAGSNNDINVLYQSPIFNDLKTGRALKIPFVANGVTYPSGYYLVDGIYPELAPLVKTIPEPADDDHKRILYKQKQESARKDVERAFGVLKKKWAILANPARALRKDRIVSMMYTCIILHNMIRKYKNYAISPRWFPEEAHQPDDPLRNEEQVQRVMRWIKSSQAHQNLQHDLIEHLAQNA
ncbi:ALP1-like protein [Tanacetum coccineum]